MSSSAATSPVPSSSTLIRSPTTDEPVTPRPSVNLETSTPTSCPSAQNPLVRAGLVPQHLADILSTSLTDEVTENRPSRRVTWVRVLTSDEYAEMVQEKDGKEKEAIQLKQQKKEERERRKIEKEEAKKRKRKE